MTKIDENWVERFGEYGIVMTRLVGNMRHFTWQDRVCKKWTGECPYKFDIIQKICSNELIGSMQLPFVY